jgi:hypothetical protein
MKIIILAGSDESLFISSCLFLYLMAFMIFGGVVAFRIERRDEGVFVLMVMLVLLMLIFFLVTGVGGKLVGSLFAVRGYCVVIASEKIPVELIDINKKQGLRLLMEVDGRYFVRACPDMSDKKGEIYFVPVSSVSKISQSPPSKPSQSSLAPQ